MTEWRPVRGYEGLYEVSDDGQVKYLAHTTAASDGRVFRYPTRTLGTRPTKAGYDRAALRKDGRVRDVFVHRLVAEAFLFDSYFDGAEVLHWDDVGSNNTLENLRWGTRSENLRDRVRNGSHHHASKTRCPQDHPYDEKNTIRARSGHRRCRACKAIYDSLRVRDRRKKAA